MQKQNFIDLSSFAFDMRMKSFIAPTISSGFPVSDSSRAIVLMVHG